jgi:predicted RNA binding protein YcfA (HicA-like mRNA interferase family)
MSSKTPVLGGRAVVRALQRAGFAVARQSGSHVIMEHPDGRFASVPVHAKRALPIGTLRGILATAGFTIDEFRGLL